MASSCPSLSIFSSPLSFIKPLQASMLAFSPCRREVTLLPRLNHHHHQQYRQRYQKEKNHPTWIRRSSSAGNGGFFFSDNIETVRSPTDIAKHFYRSINGKDLYQLEGCFADDCVFEDLAFPFPFQGVQAIENFLKDLVTAMGDNVRFVLQNIEGDLTGNSSTAAVIWHMEWKGKMIPFTRGFSFFECQTNGEQLVIKKARIVVESPIKPGKFVLELLKIVTSIFDKFPDLTEKFLQKPYAVIQYMNKIYKATMEPFIVPILIYYSHIWELLMNSLKHFIALVVKIIMTITTKK
ncbi:hypothetical protein ZOSMA_82G00180 [Zostera marina]|uniref:SnoaL-like domain-containing protein n=1 Tax=Zostera marina TaxID=29655 RepID=A0A0K9NLT5_ZOSMR|nr:hypothetical protein ZOSMA_82G00180 [Zostera marina]